jgi:23S rRNA pseudouridine1911/1915/1917 synthase
MNALLWLARSWPHGHRPTLVGRLDKLTSGLVLVARTPTAHAALQRALASRASEKDYLAMVCGRVNVARGTIALPLARDPRDRRRVVVSPAGVPSVTRFERLARSRAWPGGLSLVRCRLMTGRMHQIRVHLAARGWPIVGDVKYGPESGSAIDPALAAAMRQFPRQALHAWRLAFMHPMTRQPLRVEAPLPADMSALMEMARMNLDSRAAGTLPGTAK